MEEDRRRRSENEEDEWEYEEDIGDDKERIPKQGERYVKYSITATTHSRDETKKAGWETMGSFFTDIRLIR